MMNGLIKTNKAALQWAATNLEVNKLSDKFTTPIKNPDEPKFLNFNPD